MPDPFPFDPINTGITLAYANTSMIADMVLPRVDSGGSEKFRWYRWDKDEAFTLPNTAVGRKSEPTQVEFTATEINDRTEDQGLDDLIPFTDQMNAAQIRGGGVNPVGRAVFGLTHLIALGREKRVADLVFNAANYDAANKVQLSGTSQWTDKANSTPIDDIKAGLDAAFYRPNKMTIGRGAWTALSTHPDIVTAVAVANKDQGIVTRAQVAALFELDEVLVGESWINTAKKGQTASYARLWGKHALLHYTDNNFRQADDSFVTFGFTGEFMTRMAGSMPMPHKGLRGGELVRVGESLKEVISAADVAYYIEDAAA